MNEEALNLTTRQFLKRFGVSAQREIEQAIRAAIADGRLTGNETIAVRAVLGIPGVLDDMEVKGELALE
jgi:hypothetical protein